MRTIQEGKDEWKENKGWKLENSNTRIKLKYFLHSRLTLVFALYKAYASKPLTPVTVVYLKDNFLSG